MSATVAPAVLIVGNEAGKGLRLLWRRRPALAMGVAANAASFLVLRFFIDGGHILQPLLVATLPGMAAAAAASIASLGASGGVAEEINAGTLEQTHLSPVPAWALAAGRLGALAVEALLVTVVLGAGFVLAFGVHYHGDIGVVVPALLTLVNVAGYALLVAGLTVAVASIGAIVHVLNGAVLLFNGTLVPIVVFPEGLRVVAQFLPTTLGVRALQTMLVDGRPLSAVWADHSLPLLLVHAAVLLGLGWTTYRQHPPGAAGREVGSPMTRTLIAVGNEVHKGLLHAWAERVQILIELPLFIGFTAGTLEQVYLSPLPSWLIAAAGRVVAALAETAVVAAAVYAGVRLLVPLRIGWRPAALLPLLLVVLAVVGYSLLIGGLTLVWKRIEMLVEAQGIAVWVLSATALPLLAVPGWMATAGRLVPITPGLASLYEVMFAGRPASTLRGTGGLVRMLATTAGWLLAGILAFWLGERAARHRGSLGRY